MTDAGKKVFYDPIHGHIELHPLLVKIIDTPQFQRLRNIKQLGGAYFVYPGASHNRFEHSIGVCHLAGKLVKALKSQQPELEITPQDVLCVQIAGLCHDLGHGPFSHLFDGMFIPEACKKKGQQSENWKHETASLQMFDHMVKSNKLEEEMQKYQLNMQNDQFFIKEMIEGPPNTNKEKAKENQWPYIGRGEEKSFLYEIVSNKRNGIDVDKFDYFARDCHHLGIQNGFDYRRFIKFARACEVDGQKHICIRDKEVANVCDMFHTRFLLHKRAYQHRVNKIIEIMIRDAFLEADEHTRFTNSKGNSFTLSESINDMEAYIKVTDHVFQQILNTDDSEDSKNSKDSEDSEGRQKTQTAKKILQNIQSRNLYQYLGETQHIQGAGAAQGGHSGVQREMEINEFFNTHSRKVKSPYDEKLFNSYRHFKLNTMISKWKKELAELAQNDGLKMDDFVVLVSKFDYGMKEKDPVNNTYFYSKRKPDEAFKISREQVSKLLPTRFSEQLIRVYCKKTDEEIVKAAKHHFKQWCKNKGFPMPQDGNSAEPEIFEDENPGSAKKARKS